MHPVLEYVFEKTMHAAATATGTGEVLDAREGGFSAAAMQVSGTFVGTVTFEATVDGTNWVAMRCVNLGTGDIATTATAPGIYQLQDAHGLHKVRARISAYTSGSISVFGRAQV